MYLSTGIGGSVPPVGVMGIGVGGHEIQSSKFNSFSQEKMKAQQKRKVKNFRQREVFIAFKFLKSFTILLTTKSKKNI
jgi:hypothetical protein